MPRSENPLTVDVVDDEVVIRIGVKTLATAALFAPFHAHRFEPDDDGQFRVTDPDVFAQEVVQELNREHSDDGATFVTEMFDDAFEEVVEQGGEGFAWPANGID